MDGLVFTWDERKNLSNQEKHSVSFEEGKTVFYDEFARLIHDPGHSKDEDRFILLGFSNQFLMLVVCHCYREEEEVIRIISARRDNKSEQKMYEGFRDER